jgi:pimeloyl-ACP methyl ester carboxylesterase
MRTAKVAAIVGLAGLGLIGVGLARSWAPDRSVESLMPRWAPPPSRFVTIAGMQVHLRDQGPREDPRPILLLHGTSASLHTWDGWVAALAGPHRVIRVDLPGFGLTGPSPDGDYRLAAYVRFVVAVLDHLDVRQAVVAGNSFGGNVAWKVAVDHPERVSRLVLVDAAGYPFTPRSVPIGFRLAQWPALRPLLANLLPRSLVESSVRDVYGHPELITPELVDRYFELTLRAGNRAALSERLRQSPSGEFAAQIKQVRQPTLIIWGGRDRLIPIDSAHLFQRDIQGSRLVLFEDLGHVPQEEDPVRTAGAVQAFLTD